MKHMVRRLTALILAVLLTAVGAAAFAEERTLDPAWKNILLLGSDSRDTAEPGRTDTMIILSVNTENGEICMTSLMRDTWVPLSGANKWNKINAANFFGGPEMAVATVNDCFGMNIEDYVLVDMFSLTEIIDSLGGVDIALSEEEASFINWKLKESESDCEKVKAGESVHLNGEQAIWHVRNRSTGSDFERTERQRIVLVAMAGKVKEASVFGLFGVAATMMSYIETNLSLGEIVDLGMAALDMDLGSVRQTRIPKEGTYESGQMDNGLWTIRPDFEANKEILYQFIYEGIE